MISIITVEWYPIIFPLISLTNLLIFTRKNINHFHYVISTLEVFEVIIWCCKIILIAWIMNSLSYVLLKPGWQMQIVICMAWVGIFLVNITGTTDQEEVLVYTSGTVWIIHWGKIYPFSMMTWRQFLLRYQTPPSIWTKMLLLVPYIDLQGLI